MVPVAVAQDQALKWGDARVVQLLTRTDHWFVVPEKRPPPQRHALLILAINLLAHAGIKQQVVIAVLDQESGEVGVHLFGDTAAWHQQGLDNGNL